jgi:hypothetical protein
MKNLDALESIIQRGGPDLENAVDAMFSLASSATISNYKIARRNDGIPSRNVEISYKNTCMCAS